MEETAATAAAPSTPIDKPAIVRRLLGRKNGASLSELGDATAWQPHSVRAYLSGLRKKGLSIVLEPRWDGTKAYRLSRQAAEASNA